MPAVPYIPTTDQGLDSWASNFATKINASPGTYGLVAADAAIISGAQVTYHAAYLLGGSSGVPPTPVNPATFTAITVASKNSAKFAGVAIWRTYAAQIRLNPGVSNADKLDLGLNLPNNSPSPIPAPSTFPILSIVAAAPGLMQLRYADNTTPALRKKPAGALHMELWRGIDATLVLPVASCSLVALVQKQPYVSSFTLPTDGGKRATFFARWTSRRGLVGPWSAAISQIISG
jgi:hypothetical protein